MRYFKVICLSVGYGTRENPVYRAGEIIPASGFFPYSYQVEQGMTTEKLLEKLVREKFIQELTPEEVEAHLNTAQA